MKKITFIWCFCAGLTWSQQLPQFRQIALNASLYNPAAMAQSKQSSISLLGRWQMLGFGYEPRTISLFGQTLLKKKIKTVYNPSCRIQTEIQPLQKKKNIVFQHFVGGQVVSDNYGAFKYTEGCGSYAFNLPLNSIWKISGGVKLGIRNNVFMPNQAQVLNQSNPQLPYSGGDATYDAFLGNGLRSISLVSAAGMVLRTKQLSISGAVMHGGIPNGLTKQTSFFDQQVHWNAMLGYTFKVSTGLDIQPIAIVKRMSDGPYSFELSTLATINYIFWAGINYQYKTSAGFLAGMEISDNLKIGYAFDFSTNRINRFSNGGHEIFLSYGF